MLPPDKISYPEFEAVFDKVIEWKVKYEVNMALEAAKVGQATTPTSVEAKARRKFRQFDKDGSGSLEGAEIDAMAQWAFETMRPGGMPLSMEQIQVLSLCLTLANS